MISGGPRCTIPIPVERYNFWSQALEIKKLLFPWDEHLKLSSTSLWYFLAFHPCMCHNLSCHSCWTYGHITYISVSEPTHGQWPAPMGSRRVKWFHVRRDQFEYQLGFVHRKNGNIQVFQGDHEGVCPGMINWIKVSHLLELTKSKVWVIFKQ